MSRASAMCNLSDVKRPDRENTPGLCGCQCAKLECRRGERRLYEKAGVSEYWLVDPEVDTVRVYRRDGDGFARVQEFRRDASDVLTTRLLPAFELALDRIFRE